MNDGHVTIDMNIIHTRDTHAPKIDYLVAKESVDRDPGTTARMAPIPLKRIVSVSSEVRSRS